jgi:hypothetical protein
MESGSETALKVHGILVQKWQTGSSMRFKRGNLPEHFAQQQRHLVADGMVRAQGVVAMLDISSNKPHPEHGEP